jgi:NAD(P)-dependent dehydrogenase (short-subunit alcohol dehydrogenase family)
MFRSADESCAGRRVLVTGGSSGIGLTTARRLAEGGANVVLLARGRDGLLDAARQVRGCCGTIVADVADFEAMEAAVTEAERMLGGLDVVVGAAGAAAYGPLAEMDPDDYRQTVAITLLGAINTARAALPVLERRRGTLVIVGSVAGRLPVPWLAAYAAAKHGVRGFVRSLDGELRAQRRPVSVVLVSPGPVDTPFWRRARTPDGRLPPELLVAYPADDVAAEIARAIAAPRRLERTVGGTFALAAVVDALAPNLVQWPLGILARVGWRARSRRPISRDDVFAQPTVQATPSGGLSTHHSVLQRLRDRGPGAP